MKYLLLPVFLIACTRAPSQYEISQEAQKRYNLEKRCVELAILLRTDFAIETPGDYESGHYLCNIIDHDKKIFSSLTPMELMAITRFLLINKATGALVPKKGK